MHCTVVGMPPSGYAPVPQNPAHSASLRWISTGHSSSFSGLSDARIASLPPAPDPQRLSGVRLAPSRQFLRMVPYTLSPKGASLALANAPPGSAGRLWTAPWSRPRRLREHGGRPREEVAGGAVRALGGAHEGLEKPLGGARSAGCRSRHCSAAQDSAAAPVHTRSTLKRLR